MHPRRTFDALVHAFDEHDLLTYATAIAFNAIFAVIPLALSGLALLGVLGAESVWTEHLAPDLRGQVSPDVFHVIDSSVRNVFRARQGFWVTLGAALAVWEVSGAMRAVMTVLDRIYGVARKRGRVERYRVSLLLSLAVTVLLVAAAFVFELAPATGSALATIARWPLAAALLLAALAAVVRWAPAEHRHLALGDLRDGPGRRRLAADVAAVRDLPARARGLRVDLRQPRDGHRRASSTPTSRPSSSSAGLSVDGIAQRG